MPYAPAEDEGVTVNLDHHHLMKIGVGGGMKSGQELNSAVAALLSDRNMLNAGR